MLPYIMPKNKIKEQEYLALLWRLEPTVIGCNIIDKIMYCLRRAIFSLLQKGHTWEIEFHSV